MLPTVVFCGHGGKLRLKQLAAVLISLIMLTPLIQFCAAKHAHTLLQETKHAQKIKSADEVKLKAKPVSLKKLDKKLNDGPPVVLEKSSTAADISIEPEKRVFRSEKMNLIWDKAKQRLTPTELENFNREAAVVDKLLSSEKKAKNGGKNDSKADRTLRKLLNDYQLLTHFPEYDDAPNDKHAATTVDATGTGVVFADKKLAKLWTKAQSAGFSPEELKLLEAEFRQHQKNLDEAHATRGVITEAELRRSDERVETAYNKLNDIHATHLASLSSNRVAAGKKSTTTAAEAARTRKAVGEYASDDLEPTQFDVRTVEKLWEAAQKSDFAPHELEALRQQLEQFEAKVEKLRALRAENEAAVVDAERNAKVPLVDELSGKLRQLTTSVDALYQKISAKLFSATVEEETAKLNKVKKMNNNKKAAHPEL